MSAAENLDAPVDDVRDETAGRLSAAPDVVEVRRNGGVAALIAAASCAVAIAWFGRAASTGALGDWLLVAVTGVIGVGWLAAFVDARTPLLVADAQGARIRLGREWIGLPWSAVESVRHVERTSLLRDGRIEVVAHNPERVLSGLTPAAARQAAWASRLHGGPLALPLGLGTSVTGSTAAEVGNDLAAMAFTEADVVVREQSAPPVDEAWTPSLGADDFTSLEDVDERRAPAVRLTDRVAPWVARVQEARAVRGEAKAARAAEKARLAAEREDELEARRAAEAAERAAQEAEEAAAAAALAALEPSPTPAPAREVSAATRAEVLRVVADDDEVPVGTVVEKVTALPSGVRAIAHEGHAVEPLVIDDYEVEPAADPVVGPELRAARTRLGFSVDQLAERTRIRPHVIEAIEVDDFAPSGGDFYARGHLRTLARVLGVDAAPLLEKYDERYAHAPIEARKVFEAELATGAHGSIRGTRGGPNWSVLVAAVMGVVLIWSVVQLVMDQTGTEPETPVLNGSGGPTGGVATAEPVEVKIKAPESGAEVVVRDATGKVVHTGALAIGEDVTVEVVPPVRVQSSDGSVTVDVDGRDRGRVGPAGEPAQGTYAGN